MLARSVTFRETTMYLKRLELFGFKSFADRTEFHFRDGTTGIVGPNGCGKSNVVDAFKWIFGEQSAKGLRGSEMKDVIFNGTQHRKPAGFAEVSVVFDNTNRFLDIEFAEVAITRRLYRSGESEYLINKEKCRLRDIKELIMDTGIGRTSYSILEQGRIDVLLQASHYDRRIIFEEAAGISKYRAKKAETLRALARVEDNLTRLTDIIEEVEKRVQRLKQQASKARRFRRLTSRLKELRVRGAVADYRDSLEARVALAFRLHWAQFQTDRLERVLAALGDKLAERLADREAIASRLREQREKLAEGQVLLERTLQRIEHGEERLKECEEQRARREHESVEVREALLRLGEQIASERVQLESVSGEIEAGRQALEARAAERESARLESDRTQQALREEKDSLVELLQKRSRVANVVVQMTSEIEGLEARSMRLRSSLERVAADLDAQNEKQDAETKRLEGHRETLRELETERQAEEEKLCALRETESELEARLEATLTELHQKQSRFELLETLETNLEGVGRGVREILQREAESELARTHGLLASVVRTERPYAKAVEAVLGARAQALVVETQDGAIELLDAVRTEELGAVEVICLDRVDIERWGRYAPHEGVRGPLRDFVSGPPFLSELLDRLLANVLLVDDFATALSLSRNGLRPFRLVTPKGEVIEPWGALAIGGEKDLGLISRRSEMDELAVAVDELQRSEGEMRDRLGAARHSIHERRLALDAIGERVAVTSRSIVQCEEKLTAGARDLERLAREHAIGTKELDELARDIAARTGEKAEREKELGDVDKDVSACERSIRESEDAVARALEAVQVSEETLTQARLGVAQAERREEGLRELLRRQEANLAEREETLVSLGAAIDEEESRRNSTEEELEAARGELELVEQRVVALRELVEVDEGTDRELGALEQTYRDEIEEVRREKERVHEEREAAQLRDQEERHRRNTTLERLDEEYGIDLVELLRWEPAIRRHVAELEARDASREIGPDVEDEPRSVGTDSGTPAAAAGVEVEATPSGEADASDDASAPAETSDDAALALPPGMPEEARWLLPDPEWDRQAARSETREIQERVRRMGSVNLAALEELEELEERYRFQKAQRDDLEESERNLRGIIDEINQTSRELFLRSFEDVRKHFAELFRKCFGGGKADLVLEEGVDVLDAGVEIFARPPGKKSLSLSLMSGGEKTMTTIALLFAIFKSRPCPFCILDEVDAPLDEANVRRFVVLLRQFADESQFIVVTHNKATMAETDILYGVTMQELGVSTRVAVELESFDAEQMEREAARVRSS